MKFIILLTYLAISSALPTIEDDHTPGVRDGKNIFTDVTNAINQAVSGVFNRTTTGISPLPLPSIGNGTIFNRIQSLANRNSSSSIEAEPSAETGGTLLDRITGIANRVRNVTLIERFNKTVSDVRNRISNATFIDRIQDTAETAQSGVTNFLGAVGVLKIIPRECETTSAFLKTGMCMLESRCVEADGAIAGACERAGVCCVVPIVCGSQVTVKRSWFVNKEFPALVENANDYGCEVSVRKSEKTIKQVRLDFTHFELGRAVDGSCQEDSFEIYSSDLLLGRVDLIPPLCGVNSGQHVYVDMPEGELAELKIKVKVVEQKGRAIAPRSWRVLITQLDETEVAPKGCLQYFTENSGQIKSLNYDADNTNYVGNMNYDICFSKIVELAREAGEAKQDPSAFSLCRRDFMDVVLEQSFTGESNKMLTPAARIVKRNADLESRVSDSDDKVLTQIQQVVSQLQADRNSGLRTVVDKANNMASEKKLNESKEPVKAESVIKTTEEAKKVVPKKAVDDKVVKNTDTKPDDKSSKPDLKATMPDNKSSKPDLKATMPDEKKSKPDLKVPIPDEKMSKPDLKATKPDEKISKPDLKVTKPESDKKSTKLDDKNEQDITWLILDDGKKQIPVAETKVPDEKVINSNVKVDAVEKIPQKAVQAVPEIETEKMKVHEKPKSPEKIKETDFNTMALGELLAQHNPTMIKDAMADMVKAKPVQIPDTKPIVAAVLADDPEMPVALAEAPVAEASVAETPVAETPVAEAQVSLEDLMAPEEGKPMIKDIEQMTLKDAQEIIKKPACGGAYILVNEREVCGSFLRSNTPGEKDKRFHNAEKISIRSIEIPETSLRFSLTYQAVCRDITPVVTTESTTTTTTTAASTTTTTPESTESPKPTRRVGVIQYLLGWY